MMKKYILLIVITIVSVSVILIFGSIATAAESVEVYEIKAADQENTVTSSGQLTYDSVSDISAENYCVIDKIFVKTGEQVKAGDPLYTVSEPTDIEKVPYSSSDLDYLISMLNVSDIGDSIVEELRKYCVQRTVNAEKDGVISAISCTENQVVGKGSILMKLSDSTVLVIPVNINETSIEKVKVGQNVNIRFLAVENRKFKGKVARIADEARQSSGISGKETTVEVVVKLEDNDKTLRIGYSAECTIILSKEKNVVILPYEYLRSDEKGEYVFVARGRQALKKYIKTGTEYKKGVKVISGLRSGDKVIKDVKDIRDGDRIIIDTGEGNA